MGELKNSFDEAHGTNQSLVSDDLQQVIANSPNNIVLGTTTPFMTEIIADPAMLDSLQEAGVKHIFLELPNEIDFKIGNLLDGDIDKQNFVDTTYAYYKEHRPFSTYPEEQHKELLGQVADMILEAKDRGGMQVHFSDFRQDSDRIPQEPSMRIAMMNARMDFMNEKGFSSQEQLDQYRNADRTRFAEYRDHINEHMQNNAPEVFDRYQQMIQKQVSDLAQQSAEFIKITAQDEPFIAQTNRRMGGENDLDNFLDNSDITRIDMYKDGIQQDFFDRNILYSNTDKPDYIYSTEEKTLTSTLDQDETASPATSPQPSSPSFSGN